MIEVAALGELIVGFEPLTEENLRDMGAFASIAASLSTEALGAFPASRRRMRS